MSRVTAEVMADSVAQPTDGEVDLPFDASSTDGEDAPSKDDLGSDRGTPDRNVPDNRPEDLTPDTTPPPRDAGPEALPTRGLVAYYPCEGASGATLPDSSGNKLDATLANGSGGSTPAGFTFGAGKVGKGLAISPADKAYVSLPKGIVAKLTQVTIATWVKLNASTAFQRIFDLGLDTETFMYLTNASSSSSGVRFRIASGPLNKNQVVEGGTALPVGNWTHVTLTLGDDGIAIFVNGARVAQQAPAVMRPSDMGDTVNNYIGRSQFTADPYLDAQIDEFRIYDRVLSTTEIAELAGL
jgi:hypothetical protein